MSAEFRSRYYDLIPQIKKDMPTFMARQYAFVPEDLENVDVAILGAPYKNPGPYWNEWKEAPKRVRIQSLMYSGYVQEFDIDIFDHFNIVDYGDVEIPTDLYENFSLENMLKSIWNAERKVGEILDAGAIPITLGGGEAFATYSVIKSLSDRTKGKIGVISLDAHGDNDEVERDTGDPKVPGCDNWQSRMHDLPNIDPTKQVEIGQRSQPRSRVEKIIKQGIHYYPMWKVRQMNIEKLCNELKYAYEGTECVYLHLCMDFLGGERFQRIYEPMGMSDYETLRLMFEVGKRGFAGASFAAIPPESYSVQRFVICAIKFLLAGKALSNK